MSTSKPAPLLANREQTLYLMKRLVRGYMSDQMRRLALAVLCMILAAVTTAGFTQLVKPIIDDIFVMQKGELLIPVAGFTLLIFVTRGIASYGEGVLMSRIGLTIVSRLQSQLYHRLIKQDMAFFNVTSPGTLVSRFISDAFMLRNSVANTLTSLGKDTLTATALGAVMFYEDWLLACFAIFIFPAAVFPIVRIGRRMRKVSRNQQVQTGALATVLDESFQGIRYVKAYSMEEHEAKRADRTINKLLEIALKGARTRNALHPIMEGLGGIAVVTIVLYGGQMVISEAKTPGSFFAFIFALLLAYEPVKRLARLNTVLQEGLAAASRIFELLDMTPELQDKPDAKPLKVGEGRIQLQDVVFSYDGEGKALDKVSIEVESGKRVALVGASGSGKTTILNLVPRFYDVDEGRILIDGQDVRDVTMESLRRSMALVSQETLLFDETIRANIAYGNPEASDEEIESAARNAGAHDFIKQLPQGYDTLVGPRGTKLSGGQRQRISIARAMIRNAPILLLDEATSALDTESERHVQKALDELMVGRSSIVIAHRLSTIVDADRIYVLDNGRIVESGTHAELLAKGGNYAKLHSLQYSDESDGGSQKRVAQE
ncbi:MAG: ABC transporter ATP-binding protein [Limibacillus sp.]